MPRSAIDRCEIDHWDWRGRGKYRADAVAEQLVMLCAGHHRGTGPQAGRCWAAANRATIAEWVLAETPQFRAESRRKHLP